MHKIILSFFDFFNYKCFLLNFASFSILFSLIINDFSFFSVLLYFITWLIFLVFLRIRYSTIVCLLFFIQLLSSDLPGFEFEKEPYNLEFEIFKRSPSYYGHVYNDVEDGDDYHWPSNIVLDSWIVYKGSESDKMIGFYQYAQLVKDL